MAIEESRRSQQQRSQESTQRLLVAATDLIVEGGYAAVTLAAVGERAGYSRGLVTAKFGSKEGLLEELLERIIGTWSHRNVLPRTIGQPGGQKVIIVLDAIGRQAERDPRGLRVLYALTFEALGPVEPLRVRIAETHRTMRADLAGFLRTGLKDGSVKTGISPVREAEFIAASLRGTAYQWMLDSDGFDFVRALRHLITIVDERLRPDS
jgi:AcrR family transcriptional regulator